jgi:hypothetical protein
VGLTADPGHDTTIGGMSTDLERAPGFATRRPDDAECQTWVDRNGVTWVRLDRAAVGPDGGVCVIHVAGDLGLTAVQPCRAAFDAALSTHPSRVVLDLADTSPPKPASVALLSASRRYLLHRGVAVTLADVPAALWSALRRAHVTALYDVRSS